MPIARKKPDESPNHWDMSFPGHVLYPVMPFYTQKNIGQTVRIFAHNGQRGQPVNNSNGPCFLLTTPLQIDTFQQKTTITTGVS